MYGAGHHLLLQELAGFQGAHDAVRRAHGPLRSQPQSVQDVGCLVERSVVIQEDTDAAQYISVLEKGVNHRRPDGVHNGLIK